MVRAGCPVWDYATHPRCAALLPGRIKDLILAIYSGSLTANGVCSDSRPVHRDLFKDLTPKGHDYYAGHYRGERDCLIDYEIQILSPTIVGQDPLVGTRPAMVPHEMARFCKIMVKRLDELESLRNIPILLDSGVRLAAVV